MKLYWITTKNGTFLSIGNNENEAKINFSMTFPSESIRDIYALDNKSVQVSNLIYDYE